MNDTSSENFRAKGFPAYLVDNENKKEGIEVI